MKFFMTDEMSSKVSIKVKYGPNSIEDKIKTMLLNKNYGQGINFWGHILICDEPIIYEAGFFPEIKKYRKAKKEVELRLRINYENMLTANEKEVNRIICESLLRGVDIAENELKINDFDLIALRKDLMTLFKQEVWI